MNFKPDQDRDTVFKIVNDFLAEKNLGILTTDENRPWGGFFVLDESEADKFISLYFNTLTTEDLRISGKLSPKILVVAPEKRLSWQYHHRRAEIWKLIGGTAGIISSDSDIEKDLIHLNIGDTIQLKQGERHNE